MTRLSPYLLLSAYMQGIFPMAESREATRLHWVDPQHRGILPLDGFHLSRSLRRRIRKAAYTVSLDGDFAGVVATCADREKTWINAEIQTLYNALHALGYAHSLEIHQDGALAGGVYGVAIGGAFFGESMFSRRSNGSKLALAHLIDHLRCCGFSLFDTQFITPHLHSLGAKEIPRAAYHALLQEALTLDADIYARPLSQDHQSVLQRSTQRS